MGTFDDLIPAGKKKSGGTFDDLIPQRDSVSTERRVRRGYASYNGPLLQGADPAGGAQADDTLARINASNRARSATQSQIDRGRRAYLGQTSTGDLVTSSL